MASTHTKRIWGKKNWLGVWRLVPEINYIFQENLSKYHKIYIPIPSWLAMPTWFVFIAQNNSFYIVDSSPKQQLQNGII